MVQLLLSLGKYRLPHPSPIYSHMYRISKDILDLIGIEDHTQVQRQSGRMCGRKVWSTINGFCSFITVSLQLITIPIGKVEFESYTNRLAQGPYYHTVGDTRIISMDPSSLTLCSSAALTVPRDESVVNATLHALTTSPNLTGRNELNHTLSIHNTDDYDYYYLHPGSNVTISACTHTTPYTFDIIRGRPNFELWQAGKRGRVFASFDVNQKAYCRGPSYNYALYNVTIPEEDDWYFSADANDATVNLTLQIKDTGT